MEPPDVLEYVTGGKYSVHADNVYWDSPTRRRVRSMDRDISVLLYTNDGHVDVILYFHNLDIRIYLSRGMLVAFPSDNRYLNAAETPMAVSRYAAVCGQSVKG